MNTPIRIQDLREIPLFELLDEVELEALSTQLDQLRVLNGQYLFKMGEDGGRMFVVQHGRIELSVQDNAGERVILGYVGPGDLFGELSLLDNQPRSASAKAVEDTLLVGIDRNDLEFLVRIHPASALDMMGVLSQRIRESNALVRERVAVRNVNEEMPDPTFGERIADTLTAVSGSMPFIYFTAVWFISWIVWNSGLLTNIVPFDPFPFGLLTMVVSLEAIFLAQFVLISQNRQASRDKVRNDIEYEINLKAELEIRQVQRQVEELQDVMAQHLGKIELQTRNLSEQRRQDAYLENTPD